ncbi:MAG: hypothetical protein NXI16_08215 [Alphaproteobacteria bacterium]|nr:hypothetical protein [Alphaproteobacteria bacterium]
MYGESKFKGMVKLGDGTQDKAKFLESYSEQKLDASDPVALKHALLTACRQSQAMAQALLAGNIQTLGLEEARKSFGDQWPKMADKILLLTETTIRRHLTPKDVYLVISEEQVIILFGEGDKEDANKKALRIAEEINEKLHGASGKEDPLITSRAVVLEVQTDNVEKVAGDAAAVGNVVQDAQAAKDAKEREAVDGAKAKSSLQFWPVANLKKRLVSCYVAKLIIPEDALPDYPGAAAGHFQSEMDAMTVEQAGARIEEVKGRALLLIPVHYETLAVKGFRARLVEALKSLPEASSHRCLLDVVDLDPGTPQGRLHQLFSVVAPFVMGFSVHIPIGTKLPPDKFSGLRVRMIGTTGREVEQNPKPLAQFVKQVKSGRFRMVAYDVPTTEASILAKRCGVDYVQGAGVARYLPDLGPPFSIH